MRIPQSVSFDEVDMKFLSKAKETEGLLSEICKKALRDYYNQTPQSIQYHKDKVTELSKQIETLQQEKIFHETMLKQKEIEENKDKVKKEIELQTKEKKLKEKLIKTKDNILYYFEIEPEIADSLAKEILNIHEEDRPDYYDYVLNKGYKEKPELI